jgi:hypothetical protein
VKTGDLEPAWVIDVADGDGLADLGDVVSWRFDAHRQTTNGNVTVFSDTSPGVQATGSAAVLTHEWVAGETDVAGVLHAECVAVWPDGREQSFPSEGYARLVLEPSTD